MKLQVVVVAGLIILCLNCDFTASRVVDRIDRSEIGRPSQIAKEGRQAFPDDDYYEEEEEEEEEDELQEALNADNGAGGSADEAGLEEEDEGDNEDEEGDEEDERRFMEDKRYLKAVYAIL
uniref:Uncharacterized protein n=1 Tax=Stomoxys calcitrans TaxID=35570 RepID=A0A1I8PG88_STOCA